MVALLNNTALSTGGFDENDNPQSSCEIYDPATATWKDIAPMSIPRARHTATVLPDGRVVVIGGEFQGDAYNAQQTNSIEIYDPTAQTWSAAGNLIVARQNHTATLLKDSTILVTGGYSAVADSNGSNFLSSCEIYNPFTHTCRLVAPMLLGRHDHQALLLSTGEVLVAGGRIGGSDGTYLSEDEVYNPVNNTWREIDSMEESRITGFILVQFSDNSILAAGGRNTPNSNSPGSETLDPSTWQWTPTSPMKQHSVWVMGALMPEDRYIGTGGMIYEADWESATSMTTTATTEWYDKDDERWYYAPKMNQCRAEHGAVYLHQTVNPRLPEDMLLVAGGIITGDNQYTTTSEILDVTDPSLAAFKSNQQVLGTDAVAEPSDPQSTTLSIAGNAGNSPVALFSLDRNESVEIDLISVEGVVFKNMISGTFTQGMHSIPINTSSLRDGVYFVRMITPAGSTSAKLMVLK